ncbi:glycosyltransferase family 4 protein [Flavobacterium sp. GB2R13]|uniref:glycosyltransferase family 4 protein n=1 Tax=Flavobacterium algoris TaxID=3398733 RepID=UPI003A88EA0C
MKILMVSMPNLHFFRWTEQLQGAGHEIFWFDINDSRKKVERLDGVKQIVGWKLRWDFPGRTFVKQKSPTFYRLIQKINERNTVKVFEKKLLEIKPDVVHSFALYISCTPILRVMNKYPKMKWIFSSWGSDLYDLQNYPNHLNDIKKVLKKVDYLIADCNRDYQIAKKHGYENHFLGVFPGGGGYDLDKMKFKIAPFENKKTILIKGFQGRWGRAISILKALENLQIILSPYTIVVFGADEEVIQFAKRSKMETWQNFSVIGKIKQEEVFSLMENSFLYIGNSISDGMPNALLEAICMGVFPIQSNPGKVTEELIIDGLNGLLLNDPENIENITSTILYAINNIEMIKKGIEYNTLNLTPNFDYFKIKEKVINSYLKVLNYNEFE